MLPYDQKPWAPKLAIAVISFTILAEIAIAFWLRAVGSLDTGAVTALALILLTVIPPNVFIVRRKSREMHRESLPALPSHHPVR